MAKDRISLHNLLVSILGTSNVYFQPPSTIKLNYPCIIYKLDDISVQHADDKKYLSNKVYSITVVDRNPDGNIYDKILELPYSKFLNHFVVDNLNHYICTLTY